jgi:hypothetical protein
LGQLSELVWVSQWAKGWVALWVQGQALGWAVGLGVKWAEEMELGLVGL